MHLFKNRNVRPALTEHVAVIVALFANKDSADAEKSLKELPTREIFRNFGSKIPHIA